MLNKILGPENTLADLEKTKELKNDKKEQKKLLKM